MDKKKLTKICLTGVASAMLVGGLASCTNQAKETQKEINNKVVNVINNSSLNNNFKGEIDQYSFLSANFENVSDQYFMNLNGLAKEKDSKQMIYTTLKYGISSDVYNSIDSNNEEDSLNVVSNIIGTQIANGIVTHRVNDVKKLNDALKSAQQSPVKDYKIEKMFLYNIGDIKFDDVNMVVKFATKNASTYSITTTTKKHVIIGYNNGIPIYTWKTFKNTEYKTFYNDQDVYVKLDKDLYEQAKQDETIIFDKFCDYVKHKETDKYQLKTQSSTTEKGLSVDSAEITY